MKLSVRSGQIVIMSQEQKEVEFYAANLNAWINTRFEHDKSLQTLSTAAIGLLITLISTIGVSSIESLILHVLALACFVLCLFSVLWVFRRNAKHLEDVVNEREEKDQLLKILDHTAAWSFMAGVIFTSVIGVSTAINKYIEKEIVMTDNKYQGISGTGNKSLNEINNLRPQQQEKLSVDGITSMRPASPQPKPQAPAPVNSSSEKK